MSAGQRQHQLLFRAQQQEQKTQPRNPFDSPNLSTSSLNETESGSTSGQDEFHLERYGSNAKYKHIRQTSRATNNEEKQKPDLNIITSFSATYMPMTSKTARISEVRTEQVGPDRKQKAISIVSHKAIQSAVPSPDLDQPLPTPASTLKVKQHNSKKSTRSKPIQRLQNAMAQRQRSPFTQRIPIGITIPRTHAETVDQNTDSALPSITPVTPAIVVTPAGEQKPWVLQRRGTNEKESATSTYSAMTFGRSKHNANIPPTPRTATLENVYMNDNLHPLGRRTSQDSSQMILSDASDSARPESQGWWNLMLSPLLRAGSLASRKGRQPETPLEPPPPVPKEKSGSPALSTRSDPSFLVSPHETIASPETPRRQGLASATGSTWSRWTEWENEREASSHDADKELHQQHNPETEGGDSVSKSTIHGPGLAAEYFHACAVEQLTGESYFECINHDCAEQLPKLQSVHDIDRTKVVILGSPFDENRGLNLAADIKTPDGGAAKSPSVFSDSVSPNELPPNVRQASMVPVVKARSVDAGSDKGLETKNNESVPSDSADENASLAASASYSAPRDNSDLPNIATVAQSNPPAPQIVEVKVVHQYPDPPAPEPISEKAMVAVNPPPEKPPAAAEPSSEKAALAAKESYSPGPMSPEGEKSLAPVGAVPMSDMDQKQSPAPRYASNRLPERRAFINAETEYPPLPERAPTAPVTAQDLESKRRLDIEDARRRLEREDETAKKVGGLWRGRGCMPKNGCMGRGGREGRTKRRWIMGISIALLIIIILSIVLAVTLTGRGDNAPVESQWLNLTGFPAMPIGIMTIAAPNLVSQQKQCVTPTTMWSCALPKEDQNQIGGSQPDQPNLRFQINFRNGTVPANMTVPVEDLDKRSSGIFSSDLFVPNPTPPNQPDQVFLGETTDNITAPFDGEKTPFFITFMPAFPAVPGGFNDSAKRLIRRQSNSSLLNAIPAPEIADDGSAAPASLLPTTPYPISQPIRLYNRGLQDEHYGFYMYYEKSIYLSGLQFDQQGLAPGSNNPADADQNGGSVKNNSAARCSFAQTRFLFKFFTNDAFDGVLLPSSSSANLTDDSDQKGQKKVSSATNFNQPGSFPYPASVVVDRHGGDIDSKAAWCYGMSNGDIVKDQKIVVGEIRGFGGELINPATGLSGNGTGFNKTAGGIDGGTGGCSCLWQNWK